MYCCAPQPNKVAYSKSRLKGRKRAKKVTAKAKKSGMALTSLLQSPPLTKAPIIYDCWYGTVLRNATWFMLLIRDIRWCRALKGHSRWLTPSQQLFSLSNTELYCQSKRTMKPIHQSCRGIAPGNVPDSIARIYITIWTLSYEYWSFELILFVFCGS